MMQRYGLLILLAASAHAFIQRHECATYTSPSSLQMTGFGFGAAPEKKGSKRKKDIQLVHRVRFLTTAGDFTVSVDRGLSPLGVGRFLELVDDKFFDDQILYRVIPGFLVQFGCASDPTVHAKWDVQAGSSIPPLPDEPNRVKFRRGSLSFAGSGDNTRDCHVFFAMEPHGVNLGQASHETTLGWIDDEGLAVLDQIANNFKGTGYPDTGELQESLMKNGNVAAKKYPNLDRIISCGRV